jgi:hypothetical protein
VYDLAVPPTPMWWKRNKPARPNVIHVEMVDAATGRIFAESDIPPDQLPESFEAATTLHLGDADYDVEEADPVTAAEFRKTGRLRLVLRRVKIESIDPRSVLFSLPTISNDLPAIEPGSTKLNRNVLEIHEDDWRQTELIHLSLSAEIDEELADVARIYSEHRQGEFFNQIHVRRRIPAPLAAARIQSLSLSIPGAAPYDGLALYGVAGVVAGGWATKLASTADLFGVYQDGFLAAVCLRGTVPPDAPEAGLLAGIAIAHGLCLVDWCSCRRVEPDLAAFRDYFSPRGER